MKDINQVPLKTIGNASVLVGDVGHAEDGSQVQYNVVRVDGQPSVYLPVLKQRRRREHDCRRGRHQGGGREFVRRAENNSWPKVVFDQSVFVRAMRLKI